MNKLIFVIFSIVTTLTNSFANTKSNCGCEFTKGEFDDQSSVIYYLEEQANCSCRDKVVFGSGTCQTDTVKKICDGKTGVKHIFGCTPKDRNLRCGGNDNIPCVESPGIYEAVDCTPFPYDTVSVPDSSGCGEQCNGYCSVTLSSPTGSIKISGTCTGEGKGSIDKIENTENVILRENFMNNY